MPADYPGDDAGQEALAKWLAKEAEKAGLPPELPVMAALVESGVKNLNFGDADSVGFFQMRLSIWNQGEYAGYPDNPGLQIKWFIDTRAGPQEAADRARATRTSARTRRRGASGSPTSSARRAVPRPLPAAPRRGAPAAPLSAAPAASVLAAAGRSGRRRLRLRRSRRRVRRGGLARGGLARGRLTRCRRGGLGRRGGRARSELDEDEDGSGSSFFGLGTCSAGRPPPR